ncbi:MAG: 2Fe-2S iron-sulfur cluster-binding protein [Lysobacterales bacterium]
MPSNIKILPSGRTFACEGNSTLLEAGLQAGLALGYGCSNGNCGECIARIVSGEVRKVRHHDYMIKAEKKHSGHILMCCNTAVTDIILEAPEARGSVEIPRQHITARVRNLEFVNDDVALLHLKTPRSQRLRFLAGQQVQLGGDGIHPAIHPISSCPCDDMNLHFQLPRLPNDEFSDHVFNRLKKGDHLDVQGPEGDFVLDESSNNSLVFIAWHTGFAPVRSLIEHAMALEITNGIHLVWIARGKSARYQDNLCRSWRDAFDNFNYLPVDAHPGDGTIDTASTLKLLNITPADMGNHDFYVAGCKPLIKAYAENPGWRFMTTPSALDFNSSKKTGASAGARFD